MVLEKRKRVKRVIKEILFFVTWSYIFIKIFVIDFGSVFFNRYFPEYTDLLKYRFLIFVFVAVILWYLLKSLRFFKNIFFLIGYPFYFFLWKIPKILFWNIPKYMIARKKWLLIYAYVNSIINRIWKFKFNLLKGTLFLMCVIFTFRFNNPVILYITLLVFLFLLAVLITQKIIVAFQPLNLFKINVELSKLNEKDKKGKYKNSIISNIRNIVEPKTNTDQEAEQDIDKQEKEKKEQIEQIVVIRTFFSFFSSRIKDFLSKRTYIFIFFVKTILTFISAWFLLSFMNFVTFKILNENFQVTNNPNFFDFAYYTFHSMLHGTILDIIPIGTIAKILDIIAPFTSILITGTLITLFFTIRTEQYKNNLEEIIKYSDEHLLIIEDMLVEAHQFSFDEALDFLKSKKSFICVIVNEIEEIKGE